MFGSRESADSAAATGRATWPSLHRTAELVAAAAYVLRAPRRALFRELQHTTSGSDAIRFTRAELPWSGVATVAADLVLIEELEDMVRERFVRHAIIAERSLAGTAPSAASTTSRWTARCCCTSRRG